MRRKTPQQKKAEEYKHEIRPALDTPHAFRKGWPKKKARLNRKTRRLGKEMIAHAQEVATEELLKGVVRRGLIRKSGMMNLGERIVFNRDKRGPA